MLYVEATLCYPGIKMWWSRRGRDGTIGARCCVAWWEFRKSVTPKTKMKHPQLHCCRNLELRILRQFFAVGESNGMATYSGLRHASNISQTFRLPALESKEGIGRHSLNVWRRMSILVAWLALTRRQEMHGEPVFDRAWRCQQHRISHGQHHYLKMDIDGWMDLYIKPWHVTTCPCPYSNRRWR